MEFDFQVEGLDELERGLRQLDDALVRHIQGRGLLGMARVVVRHAKSTVRVDQGLVRASIRARRTGERFRGRRIPGAAANAYAGGRTAPHAHFLELGTVKQPAYPFMAPAIVSTKSEQQAALVRETGRELTRQVTRIAAGTQSQTVTRLIGG